MIGPNALALRVRDVTPLSFSLKRFTLEPTDGGRLPVAPPGSHLLVTLVGSHRRWRNAYSLTSAAEDAASYDIIVRRVAATRGGSAFLHDEIRTGAVIETSMPVNLFPIDRTAHKHLLISGGIGVTPFLAYLPALRAAGRPVEFHHLCQADEATVFEQLLRPAAGEALHLHPGTAARALDIGAVLRRQPVGTHLYLCGPASLMEMAAAQAFSLGWPASKLHQESFGATGGGRPFRAYLERSGIEVDVTADQSLLDAVEAAGLTPACLCRGGACGECLTNVLAGIPEHRDNYLSPAERESNRAMMICVSRAESTHLVLDL